jgi:hypothetical protein
MLPSSLLIYNEMKTLCLPPVYSLSRELEKYNLDSFTLNNALLPPMPLMIRIPFMANAEHVPITGTSHEIRKIPRLFLHTVFIDGTITM